MITFTVRGITFELGRSPRKAEPVKGPFERQEFYYATAVRFKYL